ncbi:MAG: hypothetical protein AAGJ54_09360 [Planctomycetota bacterium]
MKANAKVEFTKKWWQANRSSKCKGSGVGKALDKWVKFCTDTPVKFKTPEEFAGASEACSDLKKALKTAKSKCGKHQAETAAGIDRYEKERKLWEDALNKEYDKRLEKYKKDRQDLLDFVQKAVDDMGDMVDEIAQYDDYIDDLEDQALDDVENNAGLMIKHFYDSAKAPYSKAEKVLNEAKKRYEKDGKYIKERRGSAYDAKAYGVIQADAAKFNSIFEKATKLTGDATDHKKAVEGHWENIQGEYKSLITLFTQGKRSATQMVSEVEELATTAEKMAKNVADEAHKGSNTFKTLGTYADKASKGQLEPKYGAMMKPFIVKIGTTEKKSKQLHDKLKTYIEKGMKRIPKSVRNDDGIKPSIVRSDAALAKATDTMQNLKKDAAQAKKDAKTVIEALKGVGV